MTRLIDPAGLTACLLATVSAISGILPKMSNCYCHPGRAGGTPDGIRSSVSVPARGLAAASPSGPKSRVILPRNAAAHQWLSHRSVPLVPFYRTLHLAHSGRFLPRFRAVPSGGAFFLGREDRADGLLPRSRRRLLRPRVPPAPQGVRVARPAARASVARCSARA